MNYQVTPGALNTGIHVAASSKSQPDTNQIVQLLMQSQGKLQPLIDEFYRTPDGQKLQESMESFKKFLVNRAGISL